MSAFGSALVTGGNGMIGSALVNLLRKRQVEVTCLARSKERLVAACGPLGGIRVIEVPDLSRANLEVALAHCSADVIFHLASYGVRQRDREPQHLTDANIALTANLVELTAHWPLRRFVYAGSCAEYGLTVSREPISESHPLRPVSAYGVAKATTEFLGRALSMRHGVPFVTLRLFGVFGPGEHPERLMPYLISAVERNEPVLLTGGEQMRDYLYRDDAAEAICEAAVANLSVGEAYNVSSGRAVSVRQVGEIVADALGKSRDLLRWGVQPYRQDDPFWLVGDPRRFTAAASWRPRISVEQGIQCMIQSRRGREESAQIERAV